MSWPSEECTTEETTLLKRYAELLTIENERVNLISRKDIENVWTNHIEPCLAYSRLGRIMPNEYILDIGSGGGLPGVVNAIMFPKTEFVLVDSTKKKVDAVNRMIADLGLGNIEIIWSRVEELLEQRPEFEHAFNRSTSRSVAPIAQLARWAQPLLVSGGTLEALKGGDLSTERASTPYPIDRHTLPQDEQMNEKLTNLVIATVRLP